MGWEDIVKGKKRKKMSEHAIKAVDELMSDLRFREIREILDELYGMPSPSGHRNSTRTFSRIIPTRKELGHYLGNSPKYTSKRKYVILSDGRRTKRNVYQLKGE